MNKIIEALLKAKFPAINTSDLLEVINNTTNAEVATEIICGLYQEPWVSDVPSVEFSKTRFEIVLVGYNKWINAVEYKYKNRKTKTVWIKKDTELPAYSNTNSYQSEYYFKDFASKSGSAGLISESDYERKTIYGDLETNYFTGSCSISDWNGDLAYS